MGAFATINLTCQCKSGEKSHRERLERRSRQGLLLTRRERSPAPQKPPPKCWHQLRRQLARGASRNDGELPHAVRWSEVPCRALRFPSTWKRASDEVRQLLLRSTRLRIFLLRFGPGTDRFCCAPATDRQRPGHGSTPTHPLGWLLVGPPE